jgi:hypothetical protein
MWLPTFAKRLESWTQLRRNVATVPLPLALEMINAWWFSAPWRAYHLHWDDQESWPDPWQLLDDNTFCSLARGLGIMYTIAMLDRLDIQDVVLQETNGDNLVLVNNKKYILNWESNSIANIDPAPHPALHCVSLNQIKIKLR